VLCISCVARMSSLVRLIIVWRVVSTLTIMSANTRDVTHPGTVLTADLDESTGYVVVVDGFSTSSGIFSIRASCPTASVYPHVSDGVLNCSAPMTGTTVGGTHDIARSAERWFEFNVTTLGRYSFSSCGSAFDTYLNIYQRTSTGLTLGALVARCDDCGPCGYRTVLQNVVLDVGSYWVSHHTRCTPRFSSPLPLLTSPSALLSSSRCPPPLPSPSPRLPSPLLASPSHLLSFPSPPLPLASPPLPFPSPPLTLPRLLSHPTVLNVHCG
jgi:hypothetical protein